MSGRVVKLAENGCYAKTAVSQFKQGKPDLFKAHLIGNDAEGYKVGPAIKSRIKFTHHNLQNRLKVNHRFDAVFLRNVLIYFAAKDQENILSNVHAVMPPDGVLYIGESETLKPLDTDFEMISPTIYRPKQTPGIGSGQ